MTFSASGGSRISSFRREPENDRFLSASLRMNFVRVGTFVSGKTIFSDRPARTRWAVIRCLSHSSHRRNWAVIEYSVGPIPYMSSICLSNSGIYETVSAAAGNC